MKKVYGMALMAFDTESCFFFALNGLKRILHEQIYLLRTIDCNTESPSHLDFQCCNLLRLGFFI